MFLPLQNWGFPNHPNGEVGAGKPFAAPGTDARSPLPSSLSDFYVFG